MISVSIILTSRRISVLQTSGLISKIFVSSTPVHLLVYGLVFVERADFALRLMLNAQLSSVALQTFLRYRNSIAYSC
jgi:hypothetical protein